MRRSVGRATAARKCCGLELNLGLMIAIPSRVSNAVSYLLSAVGIRAIGGTEPRPCEPVHHVCASAARSKDGGTS
jgi:hypothetical protein